jgi:uncharacterized protein YxjI
MEIEDAEGSQIAVIKKAFISPLRDRWVVRVKDGPVRFIPRGSVIVQL